MGRWPSNVSVDVVMARREREIRFISRAMGKAVKANDLPNAQKYAERIRHLRKLNEGLVQNYWNRRPVTSEIDRSYVFGVFFQ
ncbi:MAG TPA: hypothetical protein VEC17_01645 [Candidatus Binatia bacterium]|nr:hypothetical protein [Candidatus Binatia bacterium]